MAKIELQSNPNTPLNSIEVNPSENLQGYQVTLDGKTVDLNIQWTQENAGVITYQGQQYPFALLQTQDTISFWLAGQSVTYQKPQPKSRRDNAALGQGQFSPVVQAPMPGTILKILVQPGQVVEANSPVLIMESMKMEMTLTVPCKASIQSIPCQEGQLVEMKQVLLTLEQVE